MRIVLLLLALVAPSIASAQSVAWNILQETPTGSGKFVPTGQTDTDTMAGVVAYLVALQAASGCCYSAQAQ